MDTKKSEIKFFIHDLRVEKFFLHLINIHERLMLVYAHFELSRRKTRHQDYVDRLQRRYESAHAARTTYEIAVKSRRPDAEIVKCGRAYINSTHETCRVALLPHWRNFDTFVLNLPKDHACRGIETEFHEIKNWVAAIDRRITNFTRLSDHEAPLEPISLRQTLRGYVDTTIRSYVRTASNKRVEIRLGRLDNGCLYAERARFRRLLFNLVMNSVDAMRGTEGGIIRVDVIATELLMTLRVSDQGAGMTADKIDRLLHSERSLDGELHSLGFRFVRKTVEMFNGKIFVESTPGEGTSVELTFPRYVPETDDLPIHPTAAFPAVTDEREPRVRDSDRAGAIVVDDYCRSLAPLPGCLFSITVLPDGDVDHFAHKPYDPDWMMGHEDLSPMFYRAVFRGRYETDDRWGTALALKAPHTLEDYFDFREVPEPERNPEVGQRLIHNEYVVIARRLRTSGMDGATIVYVTNEELYFEPFGDAVSTQGIRLAELADLRVVEDI